MFAHRAQLRWKRTSQDFSYNSYNRAHEVVFKDGEIVLAASSAPEFLGDPSRVDPEEAFVASLSACHMLSFLAICARKRLVVDSYDDDASGDLVRRDDGKLWMGEVTLRPRVRFGEGIDVGAAELTELHHRAHAECFIANSVKTEVRVDPQNW